MKVITSPVKHFSGTVTLKDPLPYVTVVKFEQVIRSKEDIDAGQKFLPVILESVEKWGIQNMPEGVTVETFPGTPRRAVYELIAWLLNELTVIYKGNEEGDPNG